MFLNFLCFLGVGIIPPMTIDEKETIRHLMFSVISQVNERKIESTVHLWLCHKPDFYVEASLPGNMKHCHYYDGSTMLSGFKKEDGSVTLLSKYDLKQIKDEKLRHEGALFVAYPILFCPIDPRTESGIYKHCKDLSKIDTDLAKITSDDQYRRYEFKEAACLYKFHLKTGLLDRFDFKTEKLSTVIIGEGEGDVTGYNSKIILRFAKETFGNDLGREFEDKTAEFMQLFEKRYKVKE